MEYPVLLSALILGSAGWLCGVLLSRSQTREPGAAPWRAYVIAAAGAVAAIAIVTVPGRGPGYPLAGAVAAAWGQGLALGGVAALLAGLGTLRASGGMNAFRWASAVAAPCFLSTAAVSAVLLWMRATAVETLLGVAAGWLLVSVILYLGLRIGRNADTEPAGPLSRVALAVLVLGAGFTSTLCATVALGHFRDVAGPQTTRWTTAAIALAAGVPVTMLLAAALATITGRDRSQAGPSPAGAALAPLWRVVLSAALLAGLGYLVSVRVLGDQRLFYATGAGAGAVFVLWWLLAEGEWGAADVAQAAGRGSIQGHGVLAALLTLGAIIAGFYLLAGYGTGIVVLAAWLPAGVLLTAAAVEESAREMPQADSGILVAERVVDLLLFGAVVVLYRVFTQRFEDDLAGALLTDHFAIFSMLLGALVPSLLAGMLTRSGHQAPASTPRLLVRLAFVLAAALALAAGVVVLWGARGAIGLLAGFMLGAIVYPEALAVLIALGIVIPLAQWAQPLLQIAAQTRAEKVRLLLWLAGIVVGALLAADYGGRLGYRPRRRGRPAVSVEEGADL
ncbi:MAG: hypothetical protein ACT4PY_11445 [Armatimonadota bacterium]